MAVESSERLKAAEAYFERALVTAGRQGAKSLELRTAISLSRLHPHNGKSSEAKQRLANIYRGFEEGFDFPEIQDARSILVDQ